MVCKVLGRTTLHVMSSLCARVGCVPVAQPGLGHSWTRCGEACLQA
eukprot:CAMPEP_0115731318 /NCGR_PEP_ID=MMETSP0272-20121206/84512_1 /TAXON_ID=71861 /ORGANISM="Scrippsiella trochoidea, Strain CCMP3099" /LENGTH=45 /DNA_ID= /DNA_START= /DNA_END= /DNA_ORIENTATION=